MKVTREMVDDLFKIITASLDAIAKVDANAKSLTASQLAVDVLARTFDSLKTDVEQYFLSSDDTVTDISPETAHVVIAKAKMIAASANESTTASTYEKIWNIAHPILDLFVATAKYNFPKDSITVNAIITTLNAFLAMGAQLNIDLPKLEHQT